MSSPDKEQAAEVMQAAKAMKDAADLKIDFGMIGGIILTVIALYLASSLFNFILQFVMAKTSQTIVYDMRREVDLKLAKLPLKYWILFFDFPCTKSPYFQKMIVN